MYAVDWGEKKIKNTEERKKERRRRRREKNTGRLVSPTNGAPAGRRAPRRSAPHEFRTQVHCQPRRRSTEYRPTTTIPYKQDTIDRRTGRPQSPSRRAVREIITYPYTLASSPRAFDLLLSFYLSPSAAISVLLFLLVCPSDSLSFTQHDQRHSCRHFALPAKPFFCTPFNVRRI